MDRRSFEKLVTTALVGTGVRPLFGQERGPGPYVPLKLDSVDIEPKVNEPLIIGTRKQLFLDRFIVSRTEEILFTLTPPEKHVQNPVLTGDVPSDGQVLVAAGARWDEQRKLFQLWYYSIHFETKKEEHYSAYAESADGLHWRRPKLGLFEFNGSSANNIVPAPLAMVVFDDHDADQNRRYKGIDCIKGPDVGIWFSGDGIHWTASAKNPVLAPTGDTHSLLGWDERARKYIGYFRPEGHPESSVHGQRRQVGISFSDDAENWTPIVPVLCADMHDPPGTEFYWLHATLYEGIYIGLLSVLHLDNDRLDLSQRDPAGQEQTVDAQLVCSRDGIHWNRMGNRAAWLSPGPYQSWDDQVVWPSVPFLVRDEIRLYYGGTSLRHSLADQKETVGQRYQGRSRLGGIGLATLRRDGWVGVQSNAHQQGRLTTRAFILEGSGLEVNADASAGKILIELSGADNVPLPGFSGEEAASISSNSVRHRVIWRRPFGEILGRSVRIRFTMENSKLYAFQVTA